MDRKGLTSFKSARNRKIYDAWKNMRRRCTNPKDKRWLNYGARGIKVCDRWLDFSNFYADMEPSCYMGGTLDRIDNDRGYSSENCRWASIATQVNNRNFCVFLTYKGETKNVMQWANHLNIFHMTLRNRLKRGWSVEKTLSIPVL